MVQNVCFKENLCAKSPNGLKKKDQLAIVHTKQSEYFLPIYFYIQDTFKENNFPDQTNKNGKRIALFVLVIKIRTNRLKSQKIVSVIPTLFKLLCRNFIVKQASMLRFDTLSVPIEFNIIH